MTTASQQTALERPVANTAWFLELQFASGTLRLCNYNQTFTWGGYDWTGVGVLGSIGNLEESSSIGSSPMAFGLNVSDPSILALAVGDASDYRGLPVILYFCPLTETGALVDTPEQCWDGTMDTMGIGIDNDAGQITLRCESQSYGLKRRPSMRLNSSQQKQRHPSDTGFNYLNDLISRPQLWLSLRFQKI